MASYHTVEQGEYLAQIAAGYGFQDFLTVWNHPKNAELCQLRPNPDVLFPGDRIFIPDLRNSPVTVATGKQHRFILKRPPVRLRLQLRGFDQLPLADADCELELDSETLQLHTDGEGFVEAALTPQAQRVVVRASGQEFELKVGHLDPIGERSGLAARLRNMGYLPGALGDEPGDDADLDDLRFAISLFQRDQGLQVNGDGSSEVIARILELYGC